MDQNLMDTARVSSSSNDRISIQNYIFSKSSVRKVKFRLKNGQEKFEVVFLEYLRRFESVYVSSYYIMLVCERSWKCKHHYCLSLRLRTSG